MSNPIERIVNIVYNQMPEEYRNWHIKDNAAYWKWRQELKQEIKHLLWDVLTSSEEDGEDD